MVSNDTVRRMADDTLKLENFLPYRLSYTANLVSELVAEAYREHFQLSIPEWRVIAHAAEHDGITQQEICRRTRMDKVAISRAAAALRQRGLLERLSNDQDRRSHLLILSSGGRTLYEKVAPRALDLERRIFEDFDRAGIASLVEMLGRIDRRIVSAG